MNALAVRIKKEARPLIWVWGVLVLFGIVPYVPTGTITVALFVLRPIAFWVGIPLLATLSIGHEFQHGTVSLLLVQPIERMEVWREKWIVLLPAVTTVACADLLHTTDSLFRRGWQTPLIALVWIVMTVCTSTFWTLVGRSTINGFVLNVLQGFGLYVAWRSFLITGSESRAALPWLVVGAGAVYSCLMLWLGRRKLARFEVTGDSSSTDLLTVGPRATRGRFAGLFRCQPAQPILNLIRKELRLLWLVWLLILVSILGVLCLAAFRFVPGLSIDQLILTTGSLIFTLALLTGILAGSLSMGEEQTLGTQSSNRMLPVSATLQWLIKLTVVLSAPWLGLILPGVVAHAAFARDFISLFDPTVFLLAVPSLLGLAAFFCASAVKGTVRAALLVLPAIAVVLLASEASLYLLMNTGILDAVTLRFHPFPFPQESAKLLFQWRTDQALVVIVLPLMLLQSYRLFRVEIHESFRAMASSLLWVVFLASTFVTASRLPVVVDHRASENVRETVEEMRLATARLPGDLIPPGQANPEQLTVEEVSRISYLSRTAQTLLRDANISVKRDPHDIGGDHSDYTVTVRLRNGRSFGTDGYGIRISFPFP